MNFPALLVSFALFTAVLNLFLNSWFNILLLSQYPRCMIMYCKIFITLYVIICAQKAMNRNVTPGFAHSIPRGRFCCVWLRWLPDCAGKAALNAASTSRSIVFSTMMWMFQFHWQYYDLTSDGAHLIMCLLPSLTVNRTAVVLYKIWHTTSVRHFPLYLQTAEVIP